MTENKQTVVLAFLREIQVAGSLEDAREIASAAIDVMHARKKSKAEPPTSSLMDHQAAARRGGGEQNPAAIPMARYRGGK